MKLEEISVVSQCQTAWRFTGSQHARVSHARNPRVLFQHGVLLPSNPGGKPCHPIARVRVTSNTGCSLAEALLLDDIEKDKQLMSQWTGRTPSFNVITQN